MHTYLEPMTSILSPFLKPRSSAWRGA